jgi:phospholipid/cholesterol/gamma-HCH transport system permease protein
VRSSNTDPVIIVENLTARYGDVTILKDVSFEVYRGERFMILGGLIVGVAGLDLTVYTYIQQTKSSISIFDFVTSLIKAVVFALLISGIGCQRGFQVRGGAEGVGTSTTSAVVSAIFLIIVFDSAFAIMLYYIRH